MDRTFHHGQKWFSGLDIFCFSAFSKNCLPILVQAGEVFIIAKKYYFLINFQLIDFQLIECKSIMV